MAFGGRTVALATGVGNVRSVVRALGNSASNVITTADPDEVRRADVLVVPGQGSFGTFAEALDRSDAPLREVLLEKIRGGTPYLGICLGLQILFEDSDEAPVAKGLGVFGGSVRRLEPGSEALPHMGWNRADAGGSVPTNLFPSAHYYFAHTYAAVPKDAAVTLATTTYGSQSFTSAVASGAIMGVQFHPEKSQRAGLSLIERFFARL